MSEDLAMNVLKVLKNSLSDYFNYLESYDAPSKVVMNYLVCESLRRCFGDEYNIQTGQKEKIDAYNRYIDVLISDKSGNDIGYLIINLKDNLDKEKENHKVKSLTENNNAFGLLIAFSSTQDKEIRYRRFSNGQCLSHENDVLR